MASPRRLVLPTGFLKHCIQPTYSDTKNGGNCPSGALISKVIFANFASLRLCEKKSPFKVARFYTSVSRKGAKTQSSQSSCLWAAAVTNSKAKPGLLNCGYCPPFLTANH